MESIQFRAPGRTLVRANHALQITDRPFWSVERRVMAYLGVGAALLLILIETLVS